jgi:Zinc carboxypeptidase
MPIPIRILDTDYHYHAYDFMGSQAWTLGAMQNTRNNYQFYSMAADLGGLVITGNANHVPNIALVTGAVQTAGNRDTMILEFGNQGSVAGRPTVVITGGIHSNEWMAHEMAYLLAEYLILHYNTNPVGKYQTAIRDLINSRNIRIIPMVNPDGNQESVFGGGLAGGAERLWRKNRRLLPATGNAWIAELTNLGAANPPFRNVAQPGGLGTAAQYEVPDYEPPNIPPNAPATWNTHVLPTVLQPRGVDPNRNWPTQAWGFDDHAAPSDWDPAGNTYFGPRRASEAETSNIVNYLGLAVGFGAAIDYHTYGRDIVYPSEAHQQGNVGTDYIRLGRVMEQLIKNQNGVPYVLGDSVTLVGYDATGATDDYMTLQHQARSFTVELDPAGANPGFLLPETQIRGVFESNIRGALAALSAPLPDNSPMKLLVLQVALNRYLGWNVYGRGNRLPV